MSSDSNLDFRSALQELDGASDRAAALVACSIVEIALTGPLKGRMHFQKETTINLFKPTGELGNFGAKNNLAFSLGLYGEKSHRDMKLLGQIRNMFAHDIKTNSFILDAVAHKCKNFHLVDHFYKDAPGGPHTATVDLITPHGGISFTGASEHLKHARHRYILTAQMFCMVLDKCPCQEATTPLLP